MKTPSLTENEKRIVKRLIADGERNQDVHHLINIGRTPTVNFGRLSKSQEWDIEPASDDEIARFRYEKSLVDLKTGLSPMDDERLVRSREAMISAVQVFNSPRVLFKVETFPVLSQIAWTYLLHEYYDRKDEVIEDANGNTWLLNQMIKRDDCPLSADVRKNLLAVKELRDRVEHKTLNSLGKNFWPLFQANCLNFDQALRSLFGESVGLNDELSVAIQFAKMNVEELSQLQKYDITPEIEAIDSQISEAVEETGKESAAYKFKVNYSFEKATKGDAHIVFTENNKNASKTHQILTKPVVSDELWPFKPGRVVERVREETGSNFNSHHHTLAWKRYGARPRSGAKKPSDTKKDFCQYHPAHGDYTYSEKWVQLLIEIVSDEDDFTALKTFRPKS
ncbi:hypothetical protein D1224_05095 [Henriciella barbarensis]|uniref:DUF3644 domain-containing protein n=1 Tax=Henriciella barbarensis TaxID=86342 RepID=A0A399R264_9PROT|nr:DUF3644 domain-containing protein [Henriciella barbarensis]RIJ23639.1 hypothetical protein D1224_05095 [Henriciella barbarensis]